MAESTSFHTAASAGDILEGVRSVNQPPSAVSGQGRTNSDQEGSTPSSIALSFSSDESSPAAPRGTARKAPPAFAGDNENESPRGGDSRRGQHCNQEGSDPRGVMLKAAPRRRNAGREAVDLWVGEGSDEEDSPTVPQSTVRKIRRYALRSIELEVIQVQSAILVM